MRSIVSNTKACYMCGRTSELHKHHIFYGTANRKVSEREGCWVYLCAHHHNLSKFSVHMNTSVDEWLKRKTQRIWEDKNGGREAFIRAFGKSYL